MKAMTKQQLADRAGMSVKTLSSWCRQRNSHIFNAAVSANQTEQNGSKRK